MKITRIQHGADPEVFLQSKETKRLVSAVNTIGGTKKNPILMGDGFFCQEDNVLAEFNIPPATTRRKFTLNILTGLEKLKEHIPDACEIVIRPYGYFQDKELTTKASKVFGCSPDLNCWTEEFNPAPVAQITNLRTAGGHLHIGYDVPNEAVSQQIGRALDLFISVPSVLMSDETPRRKLYGQMGSIRFKEYGVEYRTPSNFWLTSTDRIEWLYAESMRAIDFINQRKTVDLLDYDILAMAINHGEIPAANYLVDQYKLNVAA